MTRTQILLPDDLHRRAKRFADDREISLAEIARRGIELFLDRHPTSPASRADWTLPKFDAGGIKVPIDQLREISAAEESARGRKIH